MPSGTCEREIWHSVAEELARGVPPSRRGRPCGRLRRDRDKRVTPLFSPTRPMSSPGAEAPKRPSTTGSTFFPPRPPPPPGPLFFFPPPGPVLDSAPDAAGTGKPRRACLRFFSRPRTNREGRMGTGRHQEPTGPPICNPGPGRLTRWPQLRMRRISSAHPMADAAAGGPAFCNARSTRITTGCRRRDRRTGSRAPRPAPDPAVMDETRDNERIHRQCPQPARWRRSRLDADEAFGATSALPTAPWAARPEEPCATRRPPIPHGFSRASSIPGGGRRGRARKRRGQ